MAFVRQAIEHEIERFQKNRELDAMKESFTAMKAKPDYCAHQKEWQDTVEESLPPEEEVWWK